MKATATKVLIIAAAAGTLAGCASYRDERPKLAYFVVPCNTPGAFPAQAVNAADVNAPAEPQDLIPYPMRAVAASPKEAPTCLVAAAAGRPYSPAYSGYGRAPYYPHSRHFGSGIGVLFHGGGHRSGHHGGHRRH